MGYGLRALAYVGKARLAQQDLQLGKGIEPLGVELVGNHAPFRAGLTISREISRRLSSARARRHTKWFSSIHSQERGSSFPRPHPVAIHHVKHDAAAGLQHAPDRRQHGQVVFACSK